MNKTGIYLEIVRILHYIIGSDSYCRRSTYRQMDFSRKRKVSFNDYIYLILRGIKKSVQSSLYEFFDAQGKFEMEYSKQAFSKGRRRIKPEAFLELFRVVVQEFYRRATLESWHGYHLFGIDGTDLNLPCTKELYEIYGAQESQGAPQVQAQVSCVYDLLNKIIVDFRFSPYSASERNDARDMISAFDTTLVDNPVFIMDRGYPSGELIRAIEESGHKYIMRCSTEFLRGMKLPAEDNILVHKFSKLKNSMTIRVVKFPLSDGKMEYLITNLLENDITIEDFKWLYHERWKIETEYDTMKNKLQAENFSGYLPDAILQDYYATLLLANLAGVLEYDLHEQIEAAHADPDNKYKYRMNISQTISELKSKVVEMLSTRSKLKREWLFHIIVLRLTKAVVPVRPNRHEPRTKTHKSQKYSQNRKHI